MKTSYKFFILPLIAIFALPSCASKIQSSYILSSDKEVIRLEKQDHKFCNDLKLDFDKKVNSNNKMYWRCRLSMTKYKLKVNPRLPQDVQYNAKISDLMSKIAIRISQSGEPSLLRVSKKLDNLDHNKCIAMGFVSDTDDQLKVSDYFLCRKALIEDYKLIPPFFNSEYVKHPSKSYNLSFTIDARIDKRLKEYKQAEEEYPTCIKFYKDKKAFKNCASAQDESRDCFSQVSSKRFRKEAMEKTFCQQKSYIQFPDKFLKKEVNKENKAQKGDELDYYKNEDLILIGIDDLRGIGPDKTKAKKKKQKEVLDKNSKEALYSKTELNRLRQEYMAKCQKDIDSVIKEYNESLEKNCQDLATYKEEEI